jgi:hypothetical protein
MFSSNKAKIMVDEQHHSFRRALAISVYIDTSTVITKMLRIYLSYMLISKELEQKSKPDIES